MTYNEINFNTISFSQNEEFLYTMYKDFLNLGSNLLLSSVFVILFGTTLSYPSIRCDSIPKFHKILQKIDPEIDYGIDAKSIKFIYLRCGVQTSTNYHYHVYKLPLILFKDCASSEKINVLNQPSELDIIKED